MIDNEEILRSIAEVKKVCTEDKAYMDRKISGDEVNNTLKNTKNNVSPGTGGNF